MNKKGFYLRIAREKKGLTQQKLARLLYLSRETISAYETGHRQIPCEVWARAIQVLGDKRMAKVWCEECPIYRVHQVHKKEKVIA